MKDKSLEKKQQATWQSKFNASQDELRLKEKKWQDTEKLIHILISRLGLIIDCPDKNLTNNLQILIKALREGKSILELHKLIKDISERVLQLERTELISSSGSLKNTDVDDGGEHVNVELVYEVLIVLLDSINFPKAFSERIEHIKKIMLATNTHDRVLPLVAGVTALAEVLDDIFYNVKHDKEKFGLFLQQINSDLQSIDADISSSHNIQSRKQDSESMVKNNVESAVVEMENIITSQLDVEQFKGSVQSSVAAIRKHMENFQKEAEQHNQESSMMMEKLQMQLKQMEAQCESLKVQILEKHMQTLSDPLTGIRNRLAYEEAIRLEVERHKRYGRSLCLLMLDLDHFKQVNDSFGHNVGDKVLQSVAKILAANIRSVDFLARYGGEEFVVILPELEITAANKVAEKIRKSIQALKLKIDGKVVQVTISGGIAQIHENDTPESIFERADTAMYLAKKQGRNRVESE